MCIVEYLQVFHWISNFTILPLNILCHDDPLCIRILQLVCVSCIIFCITYHDRLVRLICHLPIKFVPFSDVGDTSKPGERTNDIRFLSIECFKWNLCTTHSSHTVSTAFACMKSLCPYHFLRCVIYFHIKKHSQQPFFDDGKYYLYAAIQLRCFLCHILQRNILFFAFLLKF